MPTNRLWISCPKFTVAVTIDHNDRIIDAAPIVAKFKGQPVSNLVKWAKRFGRVEGMWLPPLEEMGPDS